MSQVVLLSGASRGIGRAIAQTLHEAGYRVFGASRHPQPDADLPYIPVAMDVTDAASVQAAVARVLAQAGRIDVLINNAGYDLYGAAEETTLPETVAQMDTNFFGVVRLTQAVLPTMRRQGSGKIINVGSVGGILGLPYNGAYAASKYALEGYSESLRLEMLRFGVYVSLVQPEAVATDTLDTSIRSVAQGHPAHAAQRARMIDHMRATGRSSAVTAVTVAARVRQIVAAPAPKLRYPVGRLAHLVPWMKLLLPQRWFERFMVQQFLEPDARSA